jgi:hypothetical protein
MKKYIILFLLMACNAFSQHTNSRPVFTDGTNYWSTLGGGTNSYPIVTSTAYGLLLTNNAALPRTKAENCIENKSQTFTAAAGFETVTNFTTIGSSGITGTHSNLTPSVSGWYLVTHNVSFESTANTLVMDGHFFTNGVQVSRIGWSRGFGTAAGGQQGSASGSGLIYIDSGVNCQIKIDTDKNTTATFDHMSFIMLLLNQ